MRFTGLRYLGKRLGGDRWLLASYGFANYDAVTPVTILAGATTSLTFSSYHTFTGTCTKIRPRFAFYKPNGVIGESALANLVTLEACWVPDSGSPVRITFHGRNTWTHKYGYIDADPITFACADGRSGHFVCCLTVTDAAMEVPNGFKGMSGPLRENRGLGEGVIAGNKIADALILGIAAVGTTPPNGDRLYGPMFVVGNYAEGDEPESFAINDDSHGNTYDGQILGRNSGGFAARYCLEQYGGTNSFDLGCRAPFARLDKGGEAMQEFLDNSTVRASAYDFVTGAFIHASNHDAEGGSTLAQQKAILLDLIELAGAGKHMRRIYVFPTHPKTTSTDGWATATNQTVNAPATRGDFNDWIRGAMATEARSVLPAHVSIEAIDTTAAFEVNASNVLAANGGRFIVGSLVPDYTGTVANITGVSTFRARTDITTLTNLIGQGCVGRFTSGVNAGKAFGVEFCVVRPDGTLEINFNPAVVAPSATDAIEIFKVDSGVWKGPPSPDGVHGLKNIQGRISAYLRDHIRVARSNIAISAPVAPTVPFEPLDWGTPIRVYDPRNTDLYTLSTKLIQAGTAGDPVGAMVAALLSDGNRYGGDLIQTWTTVGVNTGDKRPTLRTSPWKYLEFDGVSDFLFDSSITTAQPITRVGVVKVRSAPGATGNIWDSGTGSSSRTQLNCSSGMVTQANAGTALGGGTRVAGTWYVIMVVYNGASSKVYVNGVQTGSGNAGTNNAIGEYIAGNRTSAMTDSVGAGPLPLDLAYLAEYAADLNANAAAMAAALSASFPGTIF